MSIRTIGTVSGTQRTISTGGSLRRTKLAVGNDTAVGLSIAPGAVSTGSATAQAPPALVSGVSIAPRATSAGAALAPGTAVGLSVAPRATSFGETEIPSQWLDRPLAGQSWAEAAGVTEDWGETEGAPPASGWVETEKPEMA